MPRKKANQPNLTRHEAHCSVCAHPQRTEIEYAFVDWENPAKIAVEYGLKNRSSVYRHAAALGLDEKRYRNLRAPLARFAERASEAPVTAAAIVQAVALLARINSRGAVIERGDVVDVNAAIEELSPEEQRRFAETGDVPSRLAQMLGGQKPLPDGDHNE